MLKAYIYESRCSTKSGFLERGRDIIGSHAGTLKSGEHLLLYYLIELAITESKKQNKTSGAVRSRGYKSEREERGYENEPKWDCQGQCLWLVHYRGRGVNQGPEAMQEIGQSTAVTSEGIGEIEPCCLVPTPAWYLWCRLKRYSMLTVLTGSSGGKKQQGQNTSTRASKECDLHWHRKESLQRCRRTRIKTKYFVKWIDILLDKMAQAGSSLTPFINIRQDTTTCIFLQILGHIFMNELQ